jgi:hypothetical protein
MTQFTRSARMAGSTRSLRQSPPEANGTTLLHVGPLGGPPFPVRLKRSVDGVAAAASVFK